MPNISQTAVVQTSNIGSNAVIQEFVVIRPGVTIGNNVVIHPHVVINQDVVIADNVEIHPGAVIGKGRSADKLVICSNCSIGANTVVFNGVEIGKNTTIENNCEIGCLTEFADNKPLIIGEESFIRSHSVFYCGSTFGPELRTGHRVTVRENTIAGVNLQIGTLSDIQGDCTIGDYVRFHSNVHIGKRTKIGDFVWVFPYVVFTNDPAPPSESLIGAFVKDFASIGTMSVILPGVVIGKHAVIGAHSLVSKDIPDSTLAYGSPAKKHGFTFRVKLKDGTNRAAYPWTRHFHRGYPEEIVQEWLKNSDFENAK
jgi:UDP-3-O-[3-hydroxymyristoyl] glucosamine N-acyltransferase